MSSPSTKTLRRAISVDPGKTALTGSEMMALVIKDPRTELTLDSLYHTTEPVRIFCDKLAMFLTPFFPAMDPEHYQSGLHETLDMAITLGYLRVSSARESSDQIAHFMYAGIQAATTVLMCYRVTQPQGRNLAMWDPWEQGALGQWIHWGSGHLMFSAAMAPTAEFRFATRSMLMQRLLRFRDVQNIARAGIDMASLDLF